MQAPGRRDSNFDHIGERNDINKDTNSLLCTPLSPPPFLLLLPSASLASMRVLTVVSVFEVANGLADRDDRRSATRMHAGTDTYQHGTQAHKSTRLDCRQRFNMDR